MARVAATMAMTLETLDSLSRAVEGDDALMVVMEVNAARQHTCGPVLAKKTSCQGPSFDKLLTSFQRAARPC